MGMATDELTPRAAGVAKRARRAERESHSRWMLRRTRAREVPLFDDEPAHLERPLSPLGSGESNSHGSRRHAGRQAYSLGALPERSGIEWSGLRDAYGDAAVVPSLLERLWSPGAADRQLAIDELWSRLCHQETVYSASAAAIPSLVDAAMNGVLTSVQRLLVLSLIVCIGRGEDTCWKGYSSKEEMEACRMAVAAFVPEIVGWAQHEDRVAQGVALQLGVYHPNEFLASGVEPASLLTDVDEEAAAAGASLARTIIASRPVDAATVRAAAAHDDDALDYLDTALTEEATDRQARAIALELLDRLRP